MNKAQRRFALRLVLVAEMVVLTIHLIAYESALVGVAMLALVNAIVLGSFVLAGFIEYRMSELEKKP